MSFNGAGLFQVNSTGNPVVTLTTVSSTWANALTADLATGLSTAILKDGTQTITANIPWGGYKITGLGSGTLSTDAVNLGQAQTAFIDASYTTTATAATTTTLVYTSAREQYFTGVTTQVVALPVASTMRALGQNFRIVNLSTGSLTVNSSGGNLVATIVANSDVTITCILLSGTAAASWDVKFTGTTAETGTGANARATSPTFVTPALGVANATSLALNGSGSGTITLVAPAVAGSNTVTFPAGTTDFSSTGGTSRVLKQVTAGAAITVAQLANTDITGLGTASTAATGTSGHALGFLDGANTYSALQTFSSGIAFANETMSTYDEGTWTPGFTAGGSSTNVTYGTQSASFTKIGRLVEVQGRLTLTNNGTGTGDTRVTGFPFTQLNTADNLAVLAVNNMANVTFAAGLTWLNLYGVINTTVMDMTCSGSATAAANLTDTGFSNTGTINFGGTYLATTS